MWLWWILSLLILIACIIFAYRMIISSYEFLPLDKRPFLAPFKKHEPENAQLSESDTFRQLTSKLRSVEDSNNYYQIQLSKLQQRLQALEELNTPPVVEPQGPVQQNEGQQEEWKELYYEENDRKEKLENELEAIRQQFEKAQNELKLAKEKNLEWVRLQSDYDLRQQEHDSLKSQIAILETQLIASGEREKELEQLLLSEITIREKYVVLQKEYSDLQSQSDSLNRTIMELGKNNMNLETRLVYLSELESKLAICEAEKAKLKAKLENHLLG